jgi:D-psicose/D-tagatose/L-ribulose 3-epimerase
MIINRRNFVRTAGAAAAIASCVSPSIGFSASPRNGKNPIGAVKPTSDFDEAVKAGLDYFEPPAYELAEMDQAAFDKFHEKVMASPIRCSRVNFFIRSLRVDGPDVNLDALAKYSESTLERCRLLGAEIVIFGSASSRSVPEGFSRDRARDQIKEFLRMAEPIARGKGIVLGVEPIRYASSNILSTGDEVVKFVREMNMPNLKMNIDYFQMHSMNESPDILWEARDKIVHIHFARFNPHGWPKSAEEDPEYKQFFGLLEKMKYRGGISVEAPGSIAENASAALEFFRKELA